MTIYIYYDAEQIWLRRTELSPACILSGDLSISSTHLLINCKISDFTPKLNVTPYGTILSSTFPINFPAFGCNWASDTSLKNKLLVTLRICLSKSSFSHFTENVSNIFYNKSKLSILVSTYFTPTFSIKNGTKWPRSLGLAVKQLASRSFKVWGETRIVSFLGGVKFIGK